MYAVKYPSFYSEPNETLQFYSTCRAKDCGWEEEERHMYRDDCSTIVCPQCGCDDIDDESEYA